MAPFPDGEVVMMPSAVVLFTPEQHRLLVQALSLLRDAHDFREGGDTKAQFLECQARSFMARALDIPFDPLRGERGL